MIKNISYAVGNTPLLRLRTNQRGNIFAKLEYLNAAGSIKDRIAKAMIEDAEQSGNLKEGGIVIEPTSGNTGIALACLCAARGYSLILTMPSSVSAERKKLLQAYGATLVLVDGGMGEAVKKAIALQKNITNSLLLNQFENPVNPQTHYLTTGREIWRSLNGKIDVFVCGVGTGGTFSGVARYLKEQNSAIKTIAVEPASSPFLSEGRDGKHKIEGIGAGFLPKTLDLSLVDWIVTVQDSEAIAFAKRLAKENGVLAGISSGAAYFAACRIAEQGIFDGKNIVTVFPDSGDRYFSTALFS